MSPCEYSELVSLLKLRVVERGQPYTNKNSSPYLGELQKHYHDTDERMVYNMVADSKPYSDKEMAVMGVDMIGRTIKGRYKLIDERGRGSFATVYVARDIENNHIYALKVMHIELSSDDELLARFQREAHILLNLSDPHI